MFCLTDELLLFEFIWIYSFQLMIIMILFHVNFNKIQLYCDSLMNNDKLLHTKHPTGYRWKSHTHTCWNTNLLNCTLYQKGKLEATEYIQFMAYWQGKYGIPLFFFRNNCCKSQDEIAADRYFMSEHLRAALRWRRTALQDDVIVSYHLTLVMSTRFERKRELCFCLNFLLPFHLKLNQYYNIVRFLLCV